MTIAATDIKLLKSERMSDAADGGGRMTSTEVPDGVAGSIFPKVSRADSVYGRVNLRKVYAAVRSSLTETYGGAHTIITDPPDNDRIGVVLFSTGSHFDDRTSARDRIESYVVAGPLSRARVYGSQVVGQRALLLYQRVEEPIPDVGQVLCLSVEASGYAAVQQYVKIDEVAHEVRTFTDGTGDFQRRVLMIKITSALVQTFIGAEPARLTTDTAPTKVRDTQVADTSHYYGIQPLAAPAAAGDISLKVASIFAPIVPSTQRETAVSMATVAGASQIVKSGDTVTVNISGSWGAGQKLYLPTGIQPGSFKFGNYSSFKDNGDGTWASAAASGTIDYVAGVATQTAGSGVAGSLSLTWVPATSVATQAHTVKIDITLTNRGSVYLQTLNPLPGVGSVTLDYRAQGKWYRLRDDGTGKLVGNSAAEGSGNVSYTSGALTVTLGALPDVDSAVLISWASSVHFVQRAGATVDTTMKGLELRFTLANAPVKQGSLALVYSLYSGSGSYTMKDSNGTLSFQGTSLSNVTGTVDYSTGDVVVKFGGSAGSTFPGTDQILSASYEQELPSGTDPLVTTSVIPVTTPTAFNCGRTNVQARSFRLVVPMQFTQYAGQPPRSINVTLIDNGAGQLVTLAGSDGGGWYSEVWWYAGVTCGVINYATGDVTLTSLALYSRNWDNVVWTQFSVSATAIVGDYSVTSKAVATTFVAKAETWPISTLGYRFDFTVSTAERLVPGSILLNLPSQCADRGNGKLYAALNYATGAATEVGTIDYASGVAVITSLAFGSTVTAVTPVLSCLTVRGDFTITAAQWRTPGSPLRPSSTYVQATAIDGTICSATSDSNGLMSGSHCRGTVRDRTGIIAVEFGDTVAGEWVPRQVFPASIRYSCVVLSNLPLDPTILGLDPVRLPSDGRVPVIRPADMAVIHETTTIELENPVVAGATYSSGRSPRVDGSVTIPATTMLELRDASGQRVPDSRYTRDLENGSITMADPLDLTGYPQPLKLRARVEDMVLVTDAQITGDISISAPLLYDYTTAAYLSTALPAGDINARVERVFDQAAWASVWSDTLAGSGSSDAPAQFNDLQYPIQVSNRGAIKERWRAHITSISPLTVSIYGESLGLIGSFNATGTIQPLNPLTGDAYFTIQPGAWGLASGWSVGNNVRWNTVAANYPIWFARTILGGAALTGDSFDVATRGDID